MKRSSRSGWYPRARVIGARTCRHDEWLVSLCEHDSERRNRDDTPLHVGDLVKHWTTVSPMTHVCAYGMSRRIYYICPFIFQNCIRRFPVLFEGIDSRSSSDFSSDAARNGFTLLVRGHASECLEFLDKVLSLVQVKLIFSFTPVFPFLFWLSACMKISSKGSKLRGRQV